MKAPAGVIEETIRRHEEWREPEDELEETFPTLRELLAHPELLQPPEPVLERFAFRGRTTGLVERPLSSRSSPHTWIAALRLESGRSGPSAMPTSWPELEKIGRFSR